MLHTVKSSCQKKSVNSKSKYGTADMAEQWHNGNMLYLLCAKTVQYNNTLKLPVQSTFYMGCQFSELSWLFL